MRALNIRIAASSLLIPLLIFLLVAVWKFSATTGTITPPRTDSRYGVTCDNLQYEGVWFVTFSPTWWVFDSQ